MKTIPLKYRVSMYRAFAQMANNGLSITDFIKQKADKAANGTPVPGGKYYRTIAERLKRSQSFSDSLSGLLPSDEHMMIIISERNNGNDVLLRLSDLAEKKSHLRGIIAAQITKFSIFSFFSALFAIILVYFIQPAISDVVDVKALNESQIYFMDVVSPFVSKWLWLFIVIILGGVFLTILSLPLLTGSVRRSLDRYSPLHSAYRDYVTATVLLGMSMFLTSGGTAIQMFSILQRTGSRYISTNAAIILARLNSGRYGFADALNIGMFSPYEFDQLTDFVEAGSDISTAVEVLGRDAIERGQDRISSQFSLAMWTTVIAILGTSLVYFGYTGYLVASTVMFGSDAANQLGF